MSVILIFILILLMLLSTLITTEFGSEFTNYIYILYLMIIPIVLIIKKDKKFKVNKLILLILFGYTFFSSVSAIVNTNINLVITSSLFLLLYLSIGVAMPSIMKGFGPLTVKITIVMLSLLVLVPLLLTGMESVPYQGIFYNTNSFGNTVTTMFTVVLIFFLGEIEKYFMKEQTMFKSKIKLIIYTFGIIICFILVTTSASRTSVVTCLILLVIGFSLLFMNIMKEKKMGSLVIKFPSIMIAVSVLVFLTLKYTDIKKNLEENILQKFLRTSAQGDVLNGRTHVWEVIINNAGMFNQSIDQLIVAPHNTFLSILSTNGWIPFLFFILFFVLCFYHSIAYFIRGDNDFKYFPIMAISSFLLMSMAEIMLYKTSMILAFVGIGLAVNNRSVNFKFK